jgi:DNA-directed RNA polymerase specialized sigma24 family protein
MKDHPAVLKYANSFARTTGMDLNDALGEARVAYSRALRAIDTGQYDPHLASFDTYVTHAVYRGMCSAAARSRRAVQTIEGIDDELPDEAPSPNRRLLLAELIRELPDDARAVVDLVLGDGIPDALVDRVLAGSRGAIDKLRSHIRRALGLRRGDRAEAAFAAISDMLAEIGT